MCVTSGLAILRRQKYCTRYVASVPEAQIQSPHPDDEIDPLPPIDGDEGDQVLGGEDEIDDPDEEESNALDDATGEDDPIEDEDFGDDESTAIGDDAEGLGDPTDDVASFDGDSEPFTEGDDAPGIGGDEYGLDEVDQNPAMNDGGEEGLEEEDEALRAEDLPPLDADDEAEQSEDGFFERLDVRDGLLWETPPWELVLAHPLEGVTALAAGDAGAYVFARKLIWLSEHGQARDLPARGLGGRVLELVASAGLIDAVSEGGRVVRSTDDGASFAALDEMRSTPRPSVPGEPTAHFEEESGRSLVIVNDRIVADVSNDADIDGDEARILVIDRRAGLVWIATRAAVLAYRSR